MIISVWWQLRWSKRQGRENRGHLITTTPAQAPLHSPFCSIMTTIDSQQSLFSAESYFGTQPPPPTLEHDIADVRSFVHRQRDLGRKVVLVTVSVTPVLSLLA